MPSRTPKSGTWAVSDFVGAADLNKDPGGAVSWNTIGTLDTAGPGSGRLLDTTFAARNGRLYRVTIALSGQYLFAGTAAAFVTNNLFIGGVLTRARTFRLGAVGDLYFGDNLIAYYAAASTGSVTLIVDQVVSAAATVRHDASTTPGHWIVEDIGPST